MRNSLVILIFMIYSRNTIFGQIWARKLKLLVQAESSYLDSLKYGEFKRDVHFVLFRVEIPGLRKVPSKNQNFYFKLKFPT